jgi:hypothetical protein
MHWIRFFLFSPVALIRPLLLWRATLFLLAFDVWFLNLPHAGRYGAGGFNVAHFAWLDRFFPTPSAGLYAGVSILIGILAFIAALRGYGRLLVTVVFFLYTYSWSMSMLDSYQHHVLLSWLLLCLIFFPEATLSRYAQTTSPSTSAKKAKPQGKGKKNKAAAASPPPSQDAEGEEIFQIPSDLPPAEHIQGRWMVWAWSYLLMLVVVAIVYIFTALNKLEQGWEESLRMLMTGKPFFVGMEHTGVRWLGVDRFWWWVSIASMLGQVVIAAAYLLAPLQDRSPKRRWKVIIGIGFLAALGFHASVEWVMSLDIGWFSWYMIALALICFLPARILEAFAGVFASLRRELFGQGLRLQSPLSLFLLWGLALGMSFLALSHAEIPGAKAIRWILLGGGILWLLFYRKLPRIGSDALLLGVSALVFWGILQFSSIRYDLYRWWGGDLRRRAEYSQALEIYKKAQRYAPPGKSRQKQIEQLEKYLQQRR